MLAGIDGCRAGWLAVVGTSPADYSVQLFQRWRDLPIEDFTCIAVDMPIGLAEGGRRACDRLARQVLPVGRKSCVFATPARAQITAESYAAANSWGRATLGRGLPIQTWHLCPKIRELDEALTPRDQEVVHEAHPELAFQRLAGTRLVPSKHRKEGLALRLLLLEEAGFRGLLKEIEALLKGAAKADDLFDAAVLLVTATRIAKGEAVRLPQESERDSRGLDMAIWY